jgi:hypothetical protein
MSMPRLTKLSETKRNTSGCSLFGLGVSGDNVQRGRGGHAAELGATLCLELLSQFQVPHPTPETNFLLNGGSGGVYGTKLLQADAQEERGRSEWMRLRAAAKRVVDTRESFGRIDAEGRNVRLLEFRCHSIAECQEVLEVHVSMTFVPQHRVVPVVATLFLFLRGLVEDALDDCKLLFGAVATELLTNCEYALEKSIMASCFSSMPM